MSLTLGGGPLAKDAPATVNYTLSSPRHSLYLHSFPRRVRARAGASGAAGRTVLDSERGVLLHETGLLPVLYVPWEDVDTSLLKPSSHTTHCPYKGDAAYWDLDPGDGRGAPVPHAVWSYPDPLPEASWLRGLASLYWDAADAWFDEDERVFGHLRDPFHRVDVRPMSAVVEISAGDRAIARTERPAVLSETGLPNRIYVPPEDVEPGVLAPSTTRTRCPYKGEAHYWHLDLGGRVVEDAAWSYPDPLSDARDVGGHLCFLHDGLGVSVDRA